MTALITVAVLLGTLTAVLLSALIRQQMKYRKLQKDIAYIRDRLSSLSVSSENGFLLLPAAGPDAEKLAAAINRLLFGFYRHKADFTREKRAMTRFLTNISHDIRTPLTVLKGNSEMLLSGAQDPAVPDPIRTMAETVDRKADQLITTIGNYFTISRITSGDFPLDLKRENLSQICCDTVLDYYDLLEERQFQVDIQIPSPPVFADTDRDALQRILKNLIDNAIRHGGSGRYIALRLLSEQGKKIIEVEDHGKGISSQQQKRIFLRNYTTAPHSEGSGLGLAIADSLAARIGAELQVHSVPDEKTVFSVILK